VQRAPKEDRIRRVPYGHEQLEFMLQPWFDVDVVESGTMASVADLSSAARAALRQPSGSPSLAQLAREAVAVRPGATAVIAVTDLTRDSPDDVLVPPLLDELNAGGIADDRVMVIVAVGLHRATTDAEKREKLGGVVHRVRVVDSNGRDPSQWADLGPIPPYGVPGSTQRIVKDADVVVATGIF